MNDERNVKLEPTCQNCHYYENGVTPPACKIDGPTGPGRKCIDWRPCAWWRLTYLLDDDASR